MVCRWSARWSGVWALLVGVALPTLAQAEEKARLVYVRGDGAADCPAEVDLRLWVIARLGYDPFSPQASRVVLARVEAREHQLLGSVEVADHEGMSTGRRELSSQNERCQDLARAMALSISLAIDPERAGLVSDEPVGARTPAPASPPPSPPPAASAPAPRVTAKPMPSHLFVRAAFESAAGQLPGWALGGGLGAGWRSGAASLALEGHGALSLGRELAPSGSLTGSLLVAGLAGCVYWGALGLCAVGYAGPQWLGTRDVAQPHTSSGLYAGFGPRVALEWPLTHELAVTVALQGVLNATRNSAVLTRREVWKTPRLGATLGVGVSAHFL